jgi:hypothetical protein
MMRKQLEQDNQLAFDFNPVFNEMLAAVGESFKPNMVNMETQAKKLLVKHHAALKTIAELHVQGELSLEEFQSDLRDEMMIFNMELVAMEAPGNAGLKKAVTGVRDVLAKAVMKRVLCMQKKTGRGNYKIQQKGGFNGCRI